MADPLSVPCEECLATTQVPCHSAYLGEGESHESRRRLADLRALEHGTCALCGLFMVYGPVLDAPIDAWHPDPQDAAACPRLPDPLTDWAAYATAINLGLSPGHPGIEHFQPLPPSSDESPEQATVTLLEQGRRLMSEREDLITVEVPVDANPGLWATPPYNETPGAVCPECTAGKCVNCTTITLDPVLDDFTTCTCTHPGATDA